MRTVHTTVIVELEQRIAVVRLNRPDKRNAISLTMRSELTDVIPELDSNPSVAGIILTGSADVFSAGADLEEALQINTAEEYRQYNDSWRRLAGAIESTRKAVVACISGYCFTGGLELALSCDIRVADPSASFAMTSARIGSVAGAGGTQRLPRLVGPGQAKRMIFTAEPIDATEALRIGLVEILAPQSGGSEAAGQQLMETISSRGPLSIGWSKEAINSGLEVDLDSGLDIEAEFSARAFGTRDKHEGMSAFLEKRQPKFVGE